MDGGVRPAEFDQQYSCVFMPRWVLSDSVRKEAHDHIVGCPGREYPAAMANPRLQGWPLLSARMGTYRMQGDDIHDYEYEVKNALARLGTDPRLREADRKLILAFHKHIKAQDVSLGRQAKYLNQLHTASTLMRVPWRRAKRTDIEDVLLDPPVPFEQGRAVPVEPPVSERPRAVDHVVHERPGDVGRLVAQRGEGEVVEVGPLLEGEAPVERAGVVVPRVGVAGVVPVVPHG